MFFITGLPRSRTAWFAAFMTATGHLCAHELLKQCQSRDVFYKTMRYRNCGNSDCGLVLTDFQKKFPHAPTLIIHRDGASEPVSGMAKALGRLKGLHVKFDEINGNIETICTHLTGITPDSAVVDLYFKLNIQTMDYSPSHGTMELWKPFPWRV